MKQIFSFLILISLLVSTPVHAQSVCPGSVFGPGNTPGNFTEFVCFFVDIVDSLIPLFASLAFLSFMWGIVQFIRSAGDEKKVSGAKEIMFWGVIGLFVLFSIFGLIQLLSSTFFGGAPIGVPLLPQ